MKQSPNGRGANLPQQQRNDSAAKVLRISRPGQGFSSVEAGIVRAHMVAACRSLGIEPTDIEVALDDPKSCIDVRFSLADKKAGIIAQSRVAGAAAFLFAAMVRDGRVGSLTNVHHHVGASTRSALGAGDAGQQEEQRAAEEVDQLVNELEESGGDFEAALGTARTIDGLAATPEGSLEASDLGFGLSSLAAQ